MRDSHLSQVLDGCDELFGVSSAEFGDEPTLFREKIKEFSSLSQFENNYWSLFFRSGANFDLRLNPVVNEVDEMGEVEL